MQAICLATIAAIVIQPFIFALYFLLPPILVGQAPSVRDVLDMMLLVIVFAAAFVFILGLPIFLVLRYSKWDNWLSLGITGLLAGAVPPSIVAWPSFFSGDYESDGEWLVLHGMPTFYGWLELAKDALIWGVHGLIGALVFYFVWRRYSHAEDARRF